MIADSKHILSKDDGKAFSKSELQRIVAIKNQEGSKAIGRRYKRGVKRLCVDDFATAKQEWSAILELMSPSMRNWIIFDASQLSAEADYRLASRPMGCAAYCTGNKAPWANYRFFLQLYEKATRERTQLGLNCTTGVWVDQMEVLPIIALGLERGRMRFVSETIPASTHSSPRWDGELILVERYRTLRQLGTWNEQTRALFRLKCKTRLSRRTYLQTYGEYYEAGSRIHPGERAHGLQ